LIENNLKDSLEYKHAHGTEKQKKIHTGNYNPFYATTRTYAGVGINALNQTYHIDTLLCTSKIQKIDQVPK
jgi:hypothetical protein